MVWIPIIAGLLVGVLINTCADSLPTVRRLRRPVCAMCQQPRKPIAWSGLIAYISRQERCPYCGAPLAIRHVLVELATPLLFTFCWLRTGSTATTLLNSLYSAVLILITVTDIEHRLIPDVIVLPAAAAGLVAAVAADPGRWWVPLVAALGAAGFLGLLWLVYPGGMGLGDVKLALLLGAVLGGAVVAALALAFLAGALLGLAMLVRFGPGARKMAVPFGPFLAAGAIAALWVGPQIIDWYGGTLA